MLKHFYQTGSKRPEDCMSQHKQCDKLQSNLKNRLERFLPERTVIYHGFDALNSCRLDECFSVSFSFISGELFYILAFFFKSPQSGWPLHIPSCNDTLMLKLAFLVSSTSHVSIESTGSLEQLSPDCEN